MKEAPPNGALKIAPIPPAAPQIIAILQSLSLKCSRFINHEPKPAPICAIGPSLLALPPEPIIIEDAIVFTIGTLSRICPFL